MTTQFAIVTAETAVLSADARVLPQKEVKFTEKRAKDSQKVRWAVYLDIAGSKARGGHQAAWLPFAASNMCIMPCREIYEATGNPYPQAHDHAFNVPSSAKYNASRKHVYIGVAVFESLARFADTGVSAAKLYGDDTFKARVDELSGNAFNWAKGMDSNPYAEAINNALRELEMFGNFVTALSTTRNRNTVYMPNPNIFAKAE